ncbi:MAG: Glycosyltransferase [Candidatus Magasanikbacteria bacterium GW2011_GWA2_56_11]|uniref:Glycosyltransferase n=1 Tax=Candidatus Magasanikbacteria bacterium GW2011_GWA2_56_11 TaxID=1619044 RepID=A0A0G1YEE5_9BACT|nr:MAG: Glycosyltransferase [Candidatus Magasanikbacteria bacterium GW2011_GWA2_56_11]
MSRRRILVFAPAYLPLLGGAEIALREIMRRLPGYEFTLITARLRPDLPTEDKSDHILVRRVGSGRRGDLWRLVVSGPSLACQMGPFDAVWAMMASYGGFAALRYIKKRETPFLLTLQEGDSFGHIYRHVWWCWPYFLRIFRRARIIQAISAHLAAWARRRAAQVPVEVVPNGVDARLFSPGTAPAVRQRHGIPEAAPLVISVSRLVKKNGVSDLIEALAYLPADCHLMLVGSGALRTALERRARRLGLAGRVHFVGQVPYEKLPEYLRAATVFCRLSRSEGLGNAFIEALSAGLPVVGTAVGGIRDFLQDGETGLMCERANPRAAARMIARLLNDPGLARELGRNGRALVESHYTWDTVAIRMDSIFSRLTEKHV